MINYAVIGAGTIGQIHAYNIYNLPNINLIYIVDNNYNKAAKLAKLTNCKASNNIYEVINDKYIDAVIIASSTSAHEEHLLACIKVNKPFICEKPISTSLSSAEKCYKKHKESGIVACMGLNRRLHKDFIKAHKKIHHGEIGKIEMLHITSRSAYPPSPESVTSSGGMIREKGAHFYDLAYWFIGSEPTEVYATGKCLIDKNLANYGDVDTASLIINFESGAIASFSFGRRSVFGQDEMIEIFGSNGMITSGRDKEGSLSIYKTKQNIGPEIKKNTYLQYYQSYIDEIKIFSKAIKGKKNVHATMLDGLRAQAVAEAAIISINKNIPITINKIWDK